MGSTTYNVPYPLMCRDLHSVGKHGALTPGEAVDQPLQCVRQLDTLRFETRSRRLKGIPLIGKGKISEMAC